MAIINPSDIDFHGKEVQDISEAILTDYYKQPSLTEFHTLVKGIKAKKQIVFYGFLGLSGQAQTDCDWENNGETIPATQKFWDPTLIGDRWEICWADFVDTFWEWALKNGLDKPDITGTTIAAFLNDRISISMREGVFRHAWFGDKNAANYSASPSGVIKNGVAVKYFNAIDGFWKQLYAIKASNADQYTEITKNAQSTKALQKFNSTDTTNQVVTGIFQDMIDNADERLVEMQGLAIYATRSLVQQYKRERRLAAGIDLAYLRTETGFDYIEVDGIKVYAMPEWDRNIKAYYDNGTKYYLPHRAILTVKENVQIGTEEESNLSAIDIFYDKKSKRVYIDYAYNLDAKIVQDHLVQIAY